MVIALILSLLHGSCLFLCDELEYVFEVVIVIHEECILSCEVDLSGQYRTIRSALMSRALKRLRRRGFPVIPGTNSDIFIDHENVKTISILLEDMDYVEVSNKDISVLIRVAVNDGKLKVVARLYDDPESTEKIHLEIVKWYISADKPIYRRIRDADADARPGLKDGYIRAVVRSVGISPSIMPEKATRLGRTKFGNNIICLENNSVVGALCEFSVDGVINSGSKIGLSIVIKEVAQAMRSTYSHEGENTHTVWRMSAYEANDSLGNLVKNNTLVFKNRKGKQSRLLSSRDRDYNISTAKRVIGASLEGIEYEVMGDNTWTVYLLDKKSRCFAYVDGKGLEAAESLLVDTLLATVGGNRPGVKVSSVVAAILKQNALAREKAAINSEEAEKDSAHSDDESTPSGNVEDVDD
jgi:hypothetical protein